MKINLPFILATVGVALILVVASYQFGQKTAVTSASTQGETTREVVTIGGDEASCPVTGEVKKKAAMIPVKVNGQTYYLCCEECRPKLLADPTKYISNSAAGTNRMASSLVQKPIVIGADEASCPVMGMVKKKVAMVPIKANGKTYYLCCEECRPKFQADPTGYINNPAPPSEKLCD